MANTLIPNYLDVDFSTMKARLGDLLSKTETFKDYNYEGSNITLLIELVSYLNALTMFYGNKIAQNQYIETADLYETVHMLSRLAGYNPKGYISAEGELTITLVAPSASEGGGTVWYLDPDRDNAVYIPAWKSVYCSKAIDSDGDPVYYTNTTSFTEIIPSGAVYPYTLTNKLHVKQGKVITYENKYTGNDLIDNRLYLPAENFDYDLDINDIYPSIELTVNGGDPWTRLSDFYDENDELNEEVEAYMFKYDKYQNYYIEFSPFRKVPEKSDIIDIKLLKSAGLSGVVGALIIDTVEDSQYIYNSTEYKYINVELLSIKNTAASYGGADPETTEKIKEAISTATHTQYRNVTRKDYIKFLEERTDIVVATVWGEQEVSPSGCFQEYNKVYISLMPNSFGTSTIELNGGTILFPQPSSYSEDWKKNIATYLEPYKMICAWEEFILPEFVYFNYIIGIKLKRTYNFNTVVEAVKNKLIWYFNSVNREFGETISFTNIMEYILNMDNVSPDDSFTAVNGIQTLIIRDVNVLSPITIPYEPNDVGNYPQYTTALVTGYENKLRHIKLGFNQFPILDVATIQFVEET